MRYDAIIIGGSYAGMAAALQLLRARRRVLVVDTGLPRNRFASHSHGFLSQDGTDPAEIIRRSREQLARYRTLSWRDGAAMSVQGRKDAFSVGLDDGTSVDGRRVLFANGVSDTLPPVEGLAERWGRSVFHCPYCHGYELDRGRIGVIASMPGSLHQALLLPEWGEVTFFTNGALVPDAAARAELSARNVSLVEEPIARLEGEAGIRLANGELLSFAGLFTMPRSKPASDVAETLGCAIEETPFGTQIATDQAKETTIPGAFACGDAARMPHSVSLAVGDGAWAGAQLHRSLVF